MAEELKACPFCGGEAEENWGGCAEIYGHEHQSVTIECTKCSAALSIDTCCEKDGSPSKGFEFSCCCCNPIGSVARSRWNTRAQLPSQGGEAVEVVAYLSRKHMAGLTFKEEIEGSEPLMTVAQHQRILAAVTHPADQVAEPANQIAWKRRDGVMGCKRFMTQKCYDAQSPQMKGNYETFYCAHCKADQVSEGVVVPRELLLQATNFGRPDLMEIALGQLTALLATTSPQ